MDVVLYAALTFWQVCRHRVVNRDGFFGSGLGSGRVRAKSWQNFALNSGLRRTFNPRCTSCPRFCPKYNQNYLATLLNFSDLT